MHKTGHPLHLIIKILFCWSHTVVSIHMEHKYLQAFFPEKSIIYLFLKVCCHQFFSDVPSRSLTIQPNHWPQPMTQYVIICMAISPSKQSEQPGVLLSILPNVKTSLHHSPSEMSHKMATVLQLSTLGWCQHIMQNLPVNQAQSSLSTDCRELLMRSQVQAYTEMVV